MLRKKIKSINVIHLYALLHQLLMAVYGFGLLFIMVRIMPQEEVGRWLLFVSALSICDMLLQGLLQTIVVKETAASKEDPEQIDLIQNNSLLLSIALVACLSICIISIKYIAAWFQIQFVFLNDFASWYPALGLFMILYNLSWWINTGKGNYLLILVQRAIFCSVSMLFLLTDYLIHRQINFQTAVISQLAGYIVSAVVVFYVNRFHFHRKFYNREVIGRFLAYGKYTIGTMIGSSLLRNADTFMIATFMNSGAVAVYALAQKIVEIFEVMLRSIAATSLPSLILSRNNSQEFTQKILIRILGLTALFLPLAIGIFIFSEEVINLISKSNRYFLSADILKVTMCYVLLLPADRFLGIALEASNHPQYNLRKTILLITVNISGNFIALYYFSSLIGVAAVSSAALITGILAGFYLLNKAGFGSLSWLSIHQSLLKFKLQ